jgi:acylphosphatase
MHRVHLVIRGQVQGVGFRWFTMVRARAAHVAGFVRNRPDGSVEVEAEGAREALTVLVAELSRGPASAVVTDVSATWSESSPSYQRFEVAD